jgi:hypothetical protein
VRAPDAAKQAASVVHGCDGMRSPGLNKAFSESFRLRQVTISILCKFLTLSNLLTATFIG